VPFVLDRRVLASASLSAARSPFSPPFHTRAESIHQHSNHLLAACGVPTALAAVRVVDDNVNELPPGAVGEIVVKGEQVLASFKTPKQVVFVDEVPKNVSGKILKRELPERFTEA
jgi:acyl-CoA synthetase (AMP-forming)/AMP-acid ligase II